MFFFSIQSIHFLVLFVFFSSKFISVVLMHGFIFDGSSDRPNVLNTGMTVFCVSVCVKWASLVFRNALCWFLSTLQKFRITLLENCLIIVFTLCSCTITCFLLKVLWMNLTCDSLLATVVFGKGRLGCFLTTSVETGGLFTMTHAENQFWKFNFEKKFFEMKLVSFVSYVWFYVLFDHDLISSILRNDTIFH